MVATPNYGLSTDITLGGNSPSDIISPSEKAIKTYVDNHAGGGGTWGSITGTLSNQTDLQDALDAKANSIDLSAVATSGSYNDLLNKPTIPDTSNLANKDLSNLSSTGNTKFQAPLVSGTNIKTINNNSLLGSGNVAVQPTLVSGTNIKTINNNSLLGSGNIDIDSLPSQTGQSGKFLTTNGTTASWANAPTELPSQSGNSGKFLTTNGSAVSWATVDTLPSQTSQSGKFLTTNGTTASWADTTKVTIRDWSV
jgi:hypothetical protein